MEAVVEPGNLRKALARVRRNKGAPGIDGMTVEELRAYLKDHWPETKFRLLEGIYEPQPVRRVEIPKASGGVRLLGVPTVLDRFIQQAVMHVLQRDWDGGFSDASYGFRPGRSAHQAVQRAQEHIRAGYAIVVDLYLEKFFDRMNYDILMGLVAKRAADKRLLKLIRGFLSAGVLDGGLVGPTTEGTPQGGPPRPPLSRLPPPFPISAASHPDPSGFIPPSLYLEPGGAPPPRQGTQTRVTKRLPPSRRLPTVSDTPAPPARSRDDATPHPTRFPPSPFSRFPHRGHWYLAHLPAGLGREVEDLIVPVGPCLAPYQPSQRYLVLDERHMEEDDLPRRNLMMTAVVRLEQSCSPAGSAVRLVSRAAPPLRSTSWLSWAISVWPPIRPRRTVLLRFRPLRPPSRRRRVKALHRR